MNEQSFSIPLEGPNECNERNCHRNRASHRIQQNLWGYGCSHPLRGSQFSFLLRETGKTLLYRRSDVDTRSAVDFWSDTAPILTSSNAVIANLESALTNHPGRWSQCWKAYRFAAHPKVADILTAGNVRAVNLANNHILDCEAQGLKDTLRHLDAAQISHVGAGFNLAAAWQPALFRAGPLTVGLIGLTTVSSNGS
jgi:hypothetical protein